MKTEKFKAMSKKCPLLRQTIVELFQSKRIEIEWLFNSHSKLSKHWERLFVLDIVDSHKLNFSMLERFSVTNNLPTPKSDDSQSYKEFLRLHFQNNYAALYNLLVIDCIKDDEAAKAFDADKRSCAYVFISGDFIENIERHCYLLKGELTTLMLQVLAKELGSEIYVYNYEENWSLIFTHYDTIYYFKR